MVRVVGIWAKGTRAPWWLAINREDSLSSLAALYDRRMAIEEQIRDTKGARFGFQLVWTQIKTPQALARFTLFIGLAILLLTAIGYALSMHRPDVRLHLEKERSSSLSGYRGLSLLPLLFGSPYPLRQPQTKYTFPYSSILPLANPLSRKEDSKVIDGQ